MFGFRETHDDYPDDGGCRFCSPLPPGSSWQRGCPTTGLPAAPLWSAADAVGRARRAVAALQAHQAGNAGPTQEADGRDCRGQARGKPVSEWGGGS